VWAFRLVAAVGIPALLLVATELSLRAAGFGYDTSAIAEVDTEHGRLGRRNLKFGWRFFPRTISRSSEPFSFPVHKPPGTVRVFVLGASAAQGTPDPAYSFSRVLEVLLRGRHPASRFEVVNLAVTAVNSHVVREVARDAARYDPDLYVVYLGNNEVIGPYGPGSTFGDGSPSLALVRASIAARSLRLGQWIDERTASLRGRDAAPPTWQGLRMFLDRKVRPDSEDLAAVYAHYRDNLRAIVRSGLGAGAGVVVSTVPSNLRDCPPFASEHRADLAEDERARWDERYAAGVAHEAAGRYDAALDAYAEAAAIDGTFADLRFRMGRATERTGDLDAAREHYVEAREHDTLRFRADRRIQEIAREVVDGFGRADVRLADPAAAMDRLAPHALPGRTFFYEHVHLRFAGAYVVAREVADALEPLLPPEVAADGAAAPVATLEECAERLAFTGWDRLRILSLLGETFVTKSPSTEQLYYDERLAEWRAEVDALARYREREGAEESAAAYRAAIRAWPADWRLRAGYGNLLAGGLGNGAAAAEQWGVVVDRVPDHGAYSMLGTSLGIAGRFEEAIEAFGRALELNPLFDEGWANLGLTRARMGDPAGAAESFERALAINPQLSPRVWIDLASALVAAGRAEEAVGRLHDALGSAPDSAELRYALGALLAEQGRTTEAVEQLRRARDLAPGHAGAAALLERLAAEGTF